MARRPSARSDCNSGQGQAVPHVGQSLDEGIDIGVGVERRRGQAEPLAARGTMGKLIGRT